MIEEKVLNEFNGKNVLVTGGSGLIGRQVVAILDDAGARIRIVSLDRVKVNERADQVVGDLANFDFCRRISADMDYVFHIAGIGASVKAAREKIASHFVPMLMMNTNILEACRLNKVRKTVYTSSIGAYAPAEVFSEAEYRIDSAPMDFAGWAKRMAEAQIHAYKVEHSLDNFAIVRPSNVYGPGDNFDPSNALVIPSLLYRIYKKERPLVVWGDGTAVRDFVFSRDVAEGIVQALHYGTGGGFVNLGSGKPCTIRDLVEALRSFIDFDYMFDRSKPTGAAKRVMDISLAERTIGYKPSTGLKDGLKQTWDWFVAHPNEHEKKHNYFAEKERIDND